MMEQPSPKRPAERKRRTELEISNWALAYVGENDPLNLYHFAVAAYEIGFQDAERIAEQKENEEQATIYLPPAPPPPATPFLVRANPECPLTAQFPMHIPNVLEGCTCLA